MKLHDRFKVLMKRKRPNGYGARAGATFYTLIETCKENGIKPYQYLCSMLHRIRECLTEEDYRKLLPRFIQI